MLDSCGMNKTGGDKGKPLKIQMIATPPNGDNPGTGTLSCPVLKGLKKLSSYLGKLKRRGWREGLSLVGSAIEEVSLGRMSLFCRGLCPLAGAGNCLLKLKGGL